MDNAFGALYKGSATVAAAVRTGIGGSGAWNSATLQGAAAKFARDTNAELAARQARIVAAQARVAAQLAVKG
ncbi:hypothetical protein EO238_34555, partial [Citrobacter sp. AAK_AS5]